MFIFTLVDRDECLLSPCFNNGTCNNTVGGYTCTCTEGWTGQICIDGNFNEFY